jgi:hypothetical protein
MPCILLDAAIVGGALMIALSLVGFTISTGIAPMPSSTAACRAMRAAVAAAPDGPVVDLGSGWGTLAISVARADRGRRVIGYEVSWFPWLVSVALARVLRLSNVSFVRADFRGVALPWPAVILCYLYPGGMRDVAHKLATEMPKPLTLVSNTFALPSMQPHETIRLDDLYRTVIRVYRWRGGRAAERPLRP